MERQKPPQRPKRPRIRPIPLTPRPFPERREIPQEPPIPGPGTPNRPSRS